VTANGVTHQIAGYPMVMSYAPNHESGARDHPSRLIVATKPADGIPLLTVDGVLDSTTYLRLRDSIIKAAIDSPRAVVIDVTLLIVPAPTAWAAFTSAGWLIGQWPDVPIALVCSDDAGRNAIIGNAVARHVPVYPTVAEAVAVFAEPGGPEMRHSARTELPRVSASVRRARELMAEWLTAWARPELIPEAKLVVTVFVENVLAHTHGNPVVRLEYKGDLVTVAVEDQSAEPAARREMQSRVVNDVSGLAIVAALCRRWGNTPTPSGKTVWAVIGPENRVSGA
jgi:hypothetical protein